MYATNSFKNDFFEARMVVAVMLRLAWRYDVIDVTT